MIKPDLELNPVFFAIKEKKTEFKAENEEKTTNDTGDEKNGEDN